MITFKAKTENGVLVRSTIESFTFPAGEVQLKTDPTIGFRPTEIAYVQFYSGTMHTDLMALAQWSRLISEECPMTTMVVVMPYLPGARADRNVPNGAKAYSEFIATQVCPDQFITFDPHSEVWMESYGHFAPLAFTTALTPKDIADHVLFQWQEYDGIIAPDAGAVSRAKGFAQTLDLPCYTATKERNFRTGKLSTFTPPQDLPDTGCFLIVDDICDGGGTFAGLANAIRKEHSEVTLDLYVSHGVFSGEAATKLPEHFEHILFTDSYISDSADRLGCSFLPINIEHRLLQQIH